MWVRVGRIPRVVRVRGPLACYSLRESGDYITLHYIPLLSPVPRRGRAACACRATLDEAQQRVSALR